jgi:hypothetical protein
MTQKLDPKKKLDEDAELTAAEVEPMGSVAAAVPRTEGSNATHDERSTPDCEDHQAPVHEGGPATIVAGTESHVADEADHHPAKTDKK